MGVLPEPAANGAEAREAAPWNPSHRITYDAQWSAANRGIYSMLAKRHG
jgi:hypothetical protein